jgi:hypothetical protein
MEHRRKIPQEAKRNEKLCEHRHWADEHMNRIVKQRRPAMFEPRCQPTGDYPDAASGAR